MADPGFATIPLTRGLFAIVDTEDHAGLVAHKWLAIGRPGYYYAARWQAGRIVRMHRELLAAPVGILVDHIDRDTLNNRRSNLRLASKQQNGANAEYPVGASGYRGVNVDRGRYRAHIRVDGRVHHLGRFGSAIDAALVYDEAAVRMHGAFAVLNFPARLERATQLETGRG
jgi:hypothetical protein